MNPVQGQHFSETLEFIRRQYPHLTAQPPQVGIVLGTGMAGLVEAIEVAKLLPYNFIPHFPLSTVESHFGRLIFGTLSGVQVVAMQGRFHYYEGYSMAQVTYPIRIMKLLGVKSLFISNAAGGLNPDFKKGDLVMLKDHINLQPENPLRGPNLDALGPRFPDMSAPYAPELINKALQIAGKEDITLKSGVYAAVAGPNLETRAEYSYLRQIGADMVGMSTVPEVIVANHMGLRTFALSIITDECFPEVLMPVTVEEIIAVAAQAEPLLTRVLRLLIADTPTTA